MLVERTYLPTMEMNRLHKKVRIEKFELETFYIGRIVNLGTDFNICVI